MMPIVHPFHKLALQEGAKFDLEKECVTVGTRITANDELAYCSVKKGLNDAEFESLVLMGSSTEEIFGEEARLRESMVPGARIELATPAFSGRRSTGELPRHTVEIV